MINSWLVKDVIDRVKTNKSVVGFYIAWAETVIDVSEEQANKVFILGKP